MVSELKELGVMYICYRVGVIGGHDLLRAVTMKLMWWAASLEGRDYSSPSRRSQGIV